MPEIEKCLCPKEVATSLGISERGATRLMASGELPSFKVRGKLWRTTPSKLAEYKQRSFEIYDAIANQSRQKIIDLLRAA